MPSTWRKIENENGFPYYLNESTNVRQWDHPKFADIKQRLDDCNYIKYSTYRVASKFRVLQQALYVDEIPLSVISGVFERHRLGATESTLSLETCDLEAVLSDIYFAANKQNHTNTDIDYATELMINFLYNIFDKDREGKIQVSSTKLLLAILSNCSLSDLQKFFFYLCADHNNCVTRLKLQAVISKLTEITTYMHEDVNFGPHLVNASIINCFSNSPGLVGINENSFIAWLESNPQLLSWIPTLYRMKSAEPIVHSAKCSVCKASPLSGLRYRCTKCSRYTQCQQCFLSARTNNSHKVSHPMREFCTEGNSQDFTQAFFKKLFGLLKCSTNLNQTSFVCDVIETKPPNTEKDCLSNSIETDACNIEPLSSPHAQLQIIIRQLEVQNRELQEMLVISHRNDKEIRKYLEDHRVHIADQIRKLKVLKDYLKTAQPTTINQTQITNRVESTPRVPSSKPPLKHLGIDLLSPIMQLSEQNEYYTPQNSWQESQSNFQSRNVIENSSKESCSIADISTWIGGRPTTSGSILRNETNAGLGDVARLTPVNEMHHDLDEVLAKLQQILANNFTLDESLENSDNGQLKNAVSEVEGMLTSLIDSVENSRATTTQPELIPDRETSVF